MNVSLICACKNRYEPLLISLSSWLLCEEIKEVIIVDWSSDKSLSHLTKLDSRIKVVTVFGQKYFNQPQPLNLAASLSTQDFLLKMDTDYILNPYYKFFDTYNIDETNFIYGPTNIEDKVAESSPYFKYLRGLLLVKKTNFNSVGGYNENLGKYYAWEDDELVLRLHLYGLKSQSLQYNHTVFHIPHPDKKRFENFEGDKDFENNIIQELSNYYSGDELKWQTEYLISQHHISKNMEEFKQPEHYHVESKTQWNIVQIDDQNYYAEKKMNKLENFPTTYYTTLEESEDRQNNIKTQFEYYGISPIPIISKRYSDSSDIVTGKYLPYMNPGTIGCAVSHLKAIKKWYNETDEEYGFFCEDDLSLETVQHWNFTWEEFIELIPEDADCVQLLRLKEGGNFSGFNFRRREQDDWSVTAYIITRDYAKKIIDEYCIGEEYHLEIKNQDVMPLVEYMIFNIGTTYSIPLFVEDVKFETTFAKSSDHDHELHMNTHINSYQSSIEWWKTEGKDKKISDFFAIKNNQLKKIVDYFPFFAPTGREMLKLRINLLKDHVDEFVICESNKTQSGNTIEYELERIIEELDLPKDKIKTIKLDIPNDEDLEIQEIDKHNCYDGNDNNVNSLRARVRERMQKDALLQVLQEYSDDTVFIHSDIDEIIKPSTIEYISQVARENLNVVIRVPLAHLEGRADMRVYMRETDLPKEWTGMFVATKTHLSSATPTQIRSNVFNPFPIVFLTENGQILQDLGWHFSWMGQSKIRKIKCKAFTHYDDNFDYLEASKYSNNDMDDFQDNLKIKEGEISPSGDKNTILRYYPIENLPKEIFEFEDVKEFLLPKTEESVLQSRVFTDIEELLTKYSLDTENAEHNFNLGVWYENEGHTAPAVSYYLRCAERSESNDLAYEALIRASHCYSKQGTRDLSAKCLLQQALSLCPKRPEAYFLLSKFSEVREWWTDCYNFADMGLIFSDFSLDPLITDVGYPGRYGLLYEKAVSGWWWGKVDESKNLLIQVKSDIAITSEYHHLVDNFASKIGFEVSI